MTTRTKLNLQTAMQTEAFAYAQCTRFAAAARINGDCAVSNTFESIARMDRYGHFARQFAFSSSGCSDAENIAAACEFKSAQIDMYNRFVREAVQDGETDTAALFARIREEELGQLEILRAANKTAFEPVEDEAVEELLAV